MRRILAWILALAALPASANLCTYGRNPMTLCKHCKDLYTVTYSFERVGQNLCGLGCTTLCGWKPQAQPEPPATLWAEKPEQPDPRRDPMHGLDPSILDGLYDEEGKYCGPVPYMKPANYYALVVDDEQVMAIARQSPVAAYFAAMMQTTGLGIPAPAEAADSILSAYIGERSIALMLRGEEDPSAYAAIERPLETDVSLLLRTRVDRLLSGRRLIVVQSELLHQPTLSTVGIPYPAFGIEIERVPGRTQNMPDQPSNPARVWRVVSWGPPANYYEAK